MSLAGTRANAAAMAAVLVSALRAKMAPVLAAALLATISASGAATAQEPCDPYLKSRPTDPVGYRLRGDRCEGIYVAEVGGASLEVASLTLGSPARDPVVADSLLLRWEPPQPARVWVQAKGLKPRLYYRMDASRPPDASSYRWPTDLLRRLGLALSEFGIVAWTKLDVGGTERVIHLPLSVDQGGGPALSYHVVVWPGRELTEVYVSVAGVGPDGRPGAFLRDGQMLGYRFYPADRGIAIDLPVSELKTPGLYYVLIAADLRGGGATSVEFWLHHARR